MTDYNHENAPAGSSDRAMGEFAHDFLGKTPKRSGDNVREKLIFEAGDLILQAELTLFHTSQAELIAIGRSFERNDRVVQIPVLLTELSEFLAQFRVVRSVHQTPGEDAKFIWPRKIADVFHLSTTPEISKKAISKPKPYHERG